MIVVVVVVIAFNTPRLNTTNVRLLIIDGRMHLNIIMSIIYTFVLDKVFAFVFLLRCHTEQQYI